ETHCGVSAYLDSYRQRQAELLKRRGGTGKEHPEPVATTWSLSFEQVERLNPMATDLLRVCAFLAPDAIPEDLLLEGASELGARVLPHALVCETLIEAYSLEFAEASRLLDQTAYYLYSRAQFPQAEPLYQRALAIREQQLGPEHPDTARSLNNLAGLYHAQGKYEQAEPLYQRALAMHEQQLGPEHPDTASSLNNLALLYQNQGKDEQAEPLLKGALAIKEQQLGPEHPDTASSLNNLAGLYNAQGNYEQAEPLLKGAL